MWVTRITATAILIWALLFVPGISVAAIEQDREWFLQAHRALQQDNLKTFKQLRARLDSYPLTPYLDIWFTHKQLDKGNDLAVEKALRQHREIPEVRELHDARIRKFAKHGQWPDVARHLNDFPGTASRLPVIAIASQWHMGQKKEALEWFSKRWQQAKKIPDYISPVFQAWKRLGHPTNADRWQRIAMYAKRNKWSKAKQLARPMSEKDRQWVNYWQSMQRNPARALNRWQQNMPVWMAQAILSDGLNRISRSDALEAWQALQKLETVISKQLGEGAVAGIRRRIALRAARQYLQVAADWLDGLPERLKNEETRAWQARLHILFHDWQRLQQVIAAMPPGQQLQSRWVYWRARSLEKTGDKQAAESLFADLATSRGYYSFLSAEHLSRPLIIEATEIEVPEAIRQGLLQNPAIERTYEWLQLGKMLKASREWDIIFADASPEQWRAAAYLAASWGWYDRTIQAAYRAGEHNALIDRFPMAFEPQVLKAAKKTGLKPELIWSIIRQESAFNQRAVSRAGARGLMQLMPRTARDVARRHKLSSKNLFSPARNIRLGTLYLSEMKKRFGGNPALAAAAYNAGSRRVSSWLKRTPFIEAEAWIEAIPYNQTRRYVQQIMAYISVYEWRQAKTPGSLKTRISKPPGAVELSRNP